MTEAAPTPPITSILRGENIIAVASGKGGVGKTFVSANMAAALNGSSVAMLPTLTVSRLANQCPTIIRIACLIAAGTAAAAP